LRWKKSQNWWHEATQPLIEKRSMIKIPLFGIAEIVIGEKKPEPTATSSPIGDGECEDCRNGKEIHRPS